VGERDRDPAVDHLCPPRRLTIVERQDVALTLKVLAAGAVAGIAANVRISHQRLAVPSLSVLHSDHMAARRVLDALPVRRRASDRCLDWDCTPLQRGLVGAGPWEPRATCERWPLRQRCAGIHSIDARLVGAAAISYSAQPEGSLLMNGSISRANCERAIQGFTPGGAGTYLRHLTHSLRSLREVSRLGNGGGYGATAGSDRSPPSLSPTGEEALEMRV
jgi:hypothetical protein